MDLAGQDTARSSTIFLTLISALSQLLGFFYRVVLSRMVGAEVMGLYHLIMPVYAVLMSVVSVGLTAAVSTLSARYLAVGNSRAANRTVNCSLVLFVVLFTPLAALTAGLYDPISVYLLGDARTQMGLLLLLPCVALTAVENIHKHFFYGTGQVRPPALVELSEQFIRTGAVLGLLALFLPQNPERTVGLIVTGMILCEVFSALTLVWLYRRRLTRLGLRGSGERPAVLTRRVASIALPIGATALLGNLMGAVNAAIVPRLLIFSMSRSEAMSAFGVISGMTLPLLTLPTLFLGAGKLWIMPRVARCWALGQRSCAGAMVERSLNVVCAILLPCMALLCVVGPELGLLLFARDDVGQYMLPLAFSVVCGAVQSVLSGALNAADRQGSAAGIALICDGVQLVLTLALMSRPGGGLEGLAAGLAVSGALGAALCLLCVHRHIGLGPGLFVQIGLPGLCAVLSGQTSLLLMSRLTRAGLSGWPRVCVTVAFGALVCLVAMNAVGFSFSEREKGR